MPELASAPAEAANDGAETIDAGPFGVWLQQALRVLRGEAEADVPCGTCRGCCRSAYYVRIRARDRLGVAHIPPAYFVRAEGMPADEVLMGWRDDGSCPALESGNCSVYVQRPLTCRDYDCRVFVPSGLAAGDDRKAEINARVRAWRFSFEGASERRAFDAIRAAAAFIRDRREHFPNGGRGVPTAPTGVAVLALKSYGVFLDAPAGPRDDDATARAIIESSRHFDAGAPA